jgi:hypothetical protein
VRRWLGMACVVALMGGCADLGRLTNSRTTYASSNATKASTVTRAKPSAEARLPGNARTDDSPYGNSGLLKPGRTEPVIPADQ